MIHPSSLEDRSSASLKQSSTLELEKSICTSPKRRYAAILLTLTISLKTLSRSGQEEDDVTATRRGKSSWADYEGVVRSEDIQLKQDYPEETVAPSQVWKEKITIHEEEALPGVPTTPPNKSQDN